MKTIRDVMTSDVIRLSPTNKIKTAVILMKGHNIGGLPVLENDRVVGVLDYHGILGKDSETLVQHIMDREFVTVPPEMSVADAAALMTKTGSSRLLVMEGEQLIGVITRGDLLPELGKSFDPITGLPRADAMRDWGIEALKRGQEITVVFVDLDQFGQFNKKYGHIMGDKVLKHVADILRSNIDTERDLLCRYAGDEFVITTTRNSEEAKQLAQLVGEELGAVANPDLPEPVAGSIGLHGGKRSKEREHVHYEATLDNLINLASKSCTLAKNRGVTVATLNGEVVVPLREDETEPDVESVEPVAVITGRAEEPEPPESFVRERPAATQAARLRIKNLNLSWSSNSTAAVEIELAHGETSSRQLRSGFALGNNALRLVAEAAAEAVCAFIRTPGYSIVVDGASLVHGYTGENLVLVTVTFIAPQTETRLSGCAIIRQDAYRAAASALLSAVNRQISPLIQHPSES